MNRERAQHLAVGDKISFEDERLPYTIQARNDRYLVCTKPFAARRTVLYTIVDLDLDIRGRDNLVFGLGYETREACVKRLEMLAAGEMAVSHRNRVPLKIRFQSPDGRKAYVAHDGDEGWCIVYATNGASARRLAANEMDCGFGDVERCKREPSLDQFCEREIPISEMLALGWWVECTGCRRRIDDSYDYHDDDHDADGNLLPGARKIEPVGTWGGGSYCCSGCRDHHEAHKAKIVEHERAAIAWVSTQVQHQFPAAVITRTHAYVDGKFERQRVNVDFTLPGLRYGVTARFDRYELRNEALYKWKRDVDDDIRFLVAQGDVAAFVAFQKSDDARSRREMIADDDGMPVTEAA